MRRGAVMALLLLMLSVACSSPTAPTGPLAVTLAPGAAATYGDLVVRFVTVTSDSRCPANALCIQQGDASMRVDARVRGVADGFTLQVNDPAHRRVVFAAYRIEVEGLAPYPFTATAIAPADYRLTLTLARN